MYFVDYKSHSVPLFLNSGILPVKLLYFKSVASLLHDVDNRHAPPIAISQIYLLARNKFIPIPRGLQ